MTEHNLPNEDDAPWLDCMDGFKQLTKQQVDGVFSPAAQAVLGAYHASPLIKDNLLHRYCLAAALRAAADQVVPEKNDKRGVCHPYIRAELLGIAAELEGAQ